MKGSYILNKKNIMKILSIFIILSFLLISCGKKEAALEYEVTKVGVGDIELSVSKTGQVVSENEVSVYTSSSQRVKDVFFKTGDNVKKGDVVVTFYPADKNETLRKIQMKNLEIKKYERNLADARRSLGRKRESKSIEVQQKSRDLHNAQELYKVGGETRVNVDDAKKALRTSRIELDTADSEERANIEDARTSLKTAKLELATLQEDMTLIKNEITSPVDGVITEMTADENYKVNTETTLFKVSDSKNMKVEVSLSDTQVKDIEVGQRVEITSDALPKGEKVEGYVSQISGVAKKSENLDESNTTVTIKMNDTKNLRPGTTISATIFYKERKNVIKIPYSAVINENGKYFVFVVGKDKKIKKREVKVGISDETYYEVTSGLSLGDNIISIVDETLKDGQKIKIADPKKPRKDNKKIIKQQNVESVPAGDAAPGGPGPM
ncbi:efflux RND transporter periplasmic adaptor subunit [Leptotrichia sp. oral taxon 847]|uniref:efflux RND transporter periplasmic adaptor subunit n=1 Tax=Leptotrichia sp. oral taxon 847 TaxID=1785996 RepID=UPI00076816EC|nr:efflux RND transporter periplasmic adaptor subunit [Leptotrichia sp. oral taxon 847]AMD95832.1 efflux transporter periplasmic adaptor subunit [Leptotrichia sp. oral taxon 847]